MVTSPEQSSAATPASGRRRGRAARESTPAPLPEPLPVDVLDAHTHPDIVDPGTLPQQLAEAQSVGVRRLVATGVDVASSRWCAEVAAASEDVWAAVAVHPNEAHTVDDAALAEIARLAALPQVRAVGETGMDLYRDTATPAQQEASFRAHVQIAREAGVALVVHDRDAHEEVLAVLAQEGAPEHTVFHCFSGDVDVARRALSAGYVLSFAGTVTFRNAEGLREAARLCPPEQMLVETDAPFLTPHPYRGHPNTSATVPYTVRALAETTGRDLDELCAGIAATGERVFGPW